LLNQVREAAANGARVFTGGDRLGKTGAYMQPTILTDITSDNPAYRQEFFGPVALFFTAKDENEAIAIANDSPYGLGARSTLPILSMARKLPAGSKPAWSLSIIHR